MKWMALFVFLLNSSFAAKAPSIEEAPFEWLVVQTFLEKLDDHNHVHEDKLLTDLVSSLNYDADADELFLTSNKKTFELRKEMIQFLSSTEKGRGEIDPLYEKWEKEGRSPINVRSKKRNFRGEGFYFFNHVHTEISQDNASLKFLKISPEKTIKLVKGFLKMRNRNGVVSLTDHDTDRGFEDVKDMADGNLEILRGIEWGGSTHMCLVDLKKDWDLLSKGREFKHEESIIKSRSSGAFRIANHPSKKDDFPYTRWLDVDGVEVWNTVMEDAAFRKLPLKKSNNREALEQWGLSLAAGKRHTAVAGSDFHFIIPCLRDRALHYPANYFPKSDGKSTKELLMEGRNSIVTMPHAPLMNLQVRFEGDNQWAQMGEEVSGSGELNVLLTADFTDTKKPMRSVCYNVVGAFSKLLTFWKKRRWELRFYNMAGELIAKEKIKPRKFGPSKSLTAGFKWNVPEGVTELVRAELWSINKKTKKVDLLGLTNPIYLNR